MVVTENSHSENAESTPTPLQSQLLNEQGIEIGN